MGLIGSTAIASKSILTLGFAVTEWPSSLGLKIKSQDFLRSISSSPASWETVDISKLRYIQDPDGIKNQGQEGTCYAQATVTCIRCAQVRLNQKSPQKAEKLYLQKIIRKFGTNGGILQEVLEWILPQLKLGYKQLKANQIQELIKMYLKKFIPVLIAVCWSKQPLSFQKKTVNLKLSYHAMVIMGAEGNYWKVQNSWGEGAHQKGIINMHHESYIMKAYIVYGNGENI